MSSRRQPKIDPDQQALPFSGDPPPLVVKIRSIDPSVVMHDGKPIDRHRWKQLRELAIAIVLCGLNDGCRAHVGTLMAVANTGCHPDEQLIGSRATFFRVRDIGEEIGLWNSHRQSNRKGNSAALREVNEKRIDELVAMTRNLRAEDRVKPEKNESSETHLRLTCDSPETHPPYIQTSESSKSLWSTVDSVDQKKHWSEDEIGTVRCVAKDLAKKISGRAGRTHNRGDRDLLCKACYLVHVASRFEQNWLEDAAEAVVRTAPANRWGLFQTMLYGGEGHPLKKRVDRELAQLTVPEELLTPPKMHDDLKVRLCRSEDV